MKGLLIASVATVSTFPVIRMKFTTCSLNVHSLSTHLNTQSNVLSIFTNIGTLITGLPSQASSICKSKDDYNASKSKHCQASRLLRKKHNMTHSLSGSVDSVVSTTTWINSNCNFQILVDLLFLQSKLGGIINIKITAPHRTTAKGYKILKTIRKRAFTQKLTTCAHWKWQMLIH